MNNKIYIAGKISGEDYRECFEKFKTAYRQAINMGFEPINPMLFTTDEMSWNECMRIVLRKMLECDSILLLPDYHKSKGAMIEYELAQKLEMNIIKIRRTDEAF